MATNPIHYSDLVVPDDSIKNLLDLLKQVQQNMASINSDIKENANSIVGSLTKVSGATSEGRQKIDQASKDAQKLKLAQDKLSFAYSDTGKRIAELTELTNQQNQANKTIAQFANANADSYNKMKAEVKMLTDQIHNMTAEQALNSIEGQKLLDKVINLKTQLKSYDDALKVHITQLKQANAESQEQDAAEAARNATLARITAAEQKLAFAQSDENKQLQSLSMQTRQANEVSKLEMILNNEKEGSYNRLSAQYSLNKIRLNALSTEERNNSVAGKQLEKDTNDIYAQMIKLQEATGNHRLSVGNYAKAWDGLGMSVNQIVRELPSAAVSINTFFLAISNNVPIFVDEIQRARREVMLAKEEGRSTTGVVSRVVSAFLSWNTVLILVLTAFSMFGGQIITFIKNIVAGQKVIMSLKDEIKNLNDELKNDTAAGTQISLVKQLAYEWSELGNNVKAQKQWIVDNKTNFDNLNISVRNVADAENIFVKHTSVMITALQLRAKATAAMSLASKSYEEAFKEQQQEETEKQFGQPWYKQLFIKAAPFISAFTASFTLSSNKMMSNIGTGIFNNIAQGVLGKSSKTSTQQGDQYIKLYEQLQDQAENLLSDAGIDDAHKNMPKTRKTPKGKQPHDYTLDIYKTDADVQKKYMETLTALEENEFDKRRKASVTTYNSETADLMVTYEKEKKIQQDREKLINDIDKKIVKVKGEHNKEVLLATKSLYESQIAQTKETQDKIIDTVKEKQKLLTKDLEDIETDRQIKNLDVLKTNISNRMDVIQKGSKAELQGQLDIIEINKQNELLQNKKKAPNEQVSETDIVNKYNTQKDYTTGNYVLTQYQEQQTLEENLFNEKKHNEREINDFKLNQQKDYLSKQLELNQKGQLNLSDLQKKSYASQIQDLNVQIKKNDQGKTLLERVFPSIDSQQEKSVEEYANTTISNIQSIISSEIQLRQEAVKTAQARVQAAQSVYQAELEAKANGYANDATTAKKELQLEKKKEEEKEKLLIRAQKVQIELDTAQQAASMITASANIWASFSKLGVIGVPLAVTAIATMWASFIAAKAKAISVTKEQEKTYGEGGYEFLDGGSHASGNDIGLGKMSDGRDRRAEGGETLAIVNKRSTLKYRREIPSIINALNSGVFNEKYQDTFKVGDKVSQYSIENKTIVDTSRMETILEDIKKQGDTKVINRFDGSTIIITKDSKRIIK